MQVVIETLLSAFASCFAVVLLSLALFGVFGIIALNLFSGLLWACTESALDKAQCVGNHYNELGVWAPRSWLRRASNFDDIFNSFQTLFEVSTLNGWGATMLATMDATAVGQAPARDAMPLAAVFFIVFVILGSVLITQLFVAVMIEAYVDKQQRLRSVEQERFFAVTRMVECMWGSRDKLPVRPGGTISGWCYDLWTDCYPHRTCNKGWMHHFHRNADWIVVSLVLVNFGFMATNHHGQSSWWAAFLEYQDFVFLLFFTIEAITKITAYGMGYISNVWHRVDGIIVIGGWLAYAVAYMTLSGFFRLFRIFRPLRLLRLVKHVHSLKAIMETLIHSVPNVVNILLLLLLLFFVFSIIGLQLFGETRFGHTMNGDNNFRTFGQIQTHTVHR